MSRIKRVLLVFNGRAGGLASPKRMILDEFTAQGIHCAVLSPDKLTRRYLARQHRIDAIVAAGGDGTVSKAADVLYQIGASIPLGVIPVGTLNHFAKDAGLPLSIPEAVRVIARGATASIDVGTVNGRVFMNNSSVGLYAALARQREALRPYAGKWFSLLLALVITSLKVRQYRVRLNIDDQTRSERTALIFIGNNRYRAEGTALARRATLNDGVLSVCILKAVRPLAILRVCWRVWRTGMEGVKDFDECTAKSVTITMKKKRAIIALDGETQHMTAPLCYEIQPGALRLLTAHRQNDNAH